MIILMSGGRASVRRVDSAPAYITYNGGFGYGDDGALLILDTDGTLPATATYGEGIARTSYGAVCVRGYGAGVEFSWNGGLPVSSIGELIVDEDAAITGWVAGLPVTATGALAVTSTTGFYLITEDSNNITTEVGTTEKIITD